MFQYDEVKYLGMMSEIFFFNLAKSHEVQCLQIGYFILAKKVISEFPLRIP